MFSVHATAVTYFLSTAPSNVSGPLSAGPRTVFTPVLVENRFCGKIFVDAFTAKRLCTIFALFWQSCNNFSKFACSTRLIQNNVDNPSLLRWICWKRVAKIQRLRGGHIWILQRLDWALKAWTAFLYNALPWPWPGPFCAVFPFITLLQHRLSSKGMLPGQVWDYQQPTCKISSSSKIASEVQVDNLSWGACIKIFVVGGLFSILYEACFQFFVEPVLNSLENLFVVEPVLKCCIATPAAHHLLGFQLKAKTDLGAEVAKIENSKGGRYWKLKIEYWYTSWFQDRPSSTVCEN